MRLKRGLGFWMPAAVTAAVFALSVHPAGATIYKWKDDQGNTHFTDNESSIPLQYRDKSRLETVRGPSEKPAPAAKESGAEPTGGQEKKPDQPKAPAAPSGKQEMPGLEKTNIEAAIEYLQGEIQRDEGLLTIMPTELNGKYFVAKVQEFLPRKESLADRIAKSEVPSLKATLGFLQSSIQQDEKEHVTGPLMKTRMIQLQGRLKSEMAMEKQLIEQLKADLAQAEKESAAARPAAGPSTGNAPESPKSQKYEPAQDKR